MLKIFILEDDPTRIEALSKILKLIYADGLELFFSNNVREARLMVQNNYPFTTYMLDHDLDNKVYVDSKEENTGYQFAKWLKDLYPNISESQIIIHSMNSVGAKNIKDILPHAELRPFPSLLEDLRHYL